MDRQTADMLIALVKGVTKTKQYNQMADPEDYIDEWGIKILINTIKAFAQGNSCSNRDYVNGQSYPDSYGYSYADLRHD